MADATTTAQNGEPLEHDVEHGEVEVLASPELPEDPEIGKGLLKPIPETTLLERVAMFVSAAAVATAVAAMIVEGSFAVFLGGALSIVVAPYAYYQQTQMTDIKALTDTKNALEEHVNKMKAENERLANNIQTLGDSVEQLKETEHALEAITKTQGQSVDEFARQVEESKEILRRMRTNLKSNILQNILSVVLRSDTDRDFVMDDDEIDTMLAHFESISGVEVHEDRFRKAIAGKSIQDVMTVVRNLLKDNIPPEERIFEVDEEEENGGL